MTSYLDEYKCSDEFKNLVSRIIPGQSKEYYKELYKEMLDYIDNDVNGEGLKMRHSDFYRTLWRINAWMDK